MGTCRCLLSSLRYGRRRSVPALGLGVWFTRFFDKTFTKYRNYYVRRTWIKIFLGVHGMSFRDSTAAVAVLATAAAVLAVAAGFVLIQLYIVPVHRLQPAITRLFGLTCAAVAEQRPVAKAHTPFSYIIYQSADAAYAPLLEATGIVHRAYAERHGATLHVRHGPEPGLRAVRSGAAAYQPETAWLNRIVALAREVEAPNHDWFVFVDADAIIAKPMVSMDAVTTTPNASQYALLLCGTSREDGVWARNSAGQLDANAGVFFANLRQPALAPVVCSWHRRAMHELWRRHTLIGRLWRRYVWPLGQVHDQLILHSVLRDFPTAALLFPTHGLPHRPCRFNGYGDLITHILDAHGARAKLAKLRKLARHIEKRAGLLKSNASNSSRGQPLRIKQKRHWPHSFAQQGRIKRRRRRGGL